MKPGQVDSGFGYQRNQPGYEIQWLEYDVCGAVTPGRSPKAPTFGSIRSEPVHCGSLITAL